MFSNSQGNQINLQLPNSSNPQPYSISSRLINHNLETNNNNLQQQPQRRYKFSQTIRVTCRGQTKEIILGAPEAVLPLDLSYLEEVSGPSQILITTLVEEIQEEGEVVTHEVEVVILEEEETQEGDLQQDNQVVHQQEHQQDQP